jgi:hypothetical protein
MAEESTPVAIDRTYCRPFVGSAVMLLACGAAGYASRRWPHYLPVLIRKRTGDAMWAAAIFALATVVKPRWSPARAAAVTLAIAFSIEFSQIYHRPWLDRIRRTLFGRLVLGSGFSWLDQLAYVVGVVIVVLVDVCLSAERRGIL